MFPTLRALSPEKERHSHGFRDYERTYEKPANVFRILVLGDSYIEAFQVQQEDSFTAQLEKMLNAQISSVRLDVVSLGQSGFGTAEEYLRYINVGVAYKPDLVVLAFTIGNDFRNNSKLLNHGSLAHYFVFDEDHHLCAGSFTNRCLSKWTYLSQMAVSKPKSSVTLAHVDR
jgi:hypothetical protein